MSKTMDQREKKERKEEKQVSEKQKSKAKNMKCLDLTLVERQRENIEQSHGA